MSHQLFPALIALLVMVSIELPYNFFMLPTLCQMLDFAVEERKHL